MFERCMKCGDDFKPRRHGQRTCSTPCYRALYREENADKKLRRDRARYSRLKVQITAEERVRRRNDPQYREKIRQKNKATALERRAKFKAMGLNAHGQPFSKRGPKPKTDLH